MRTDEPKQVMTKSKLTLVNLALLLVTVIIVPLATLYPFDFSLPASFSLSELVASFQLLNQ